MSLKCVLCNLEFKNDDQLSQHVNGRKHKKFESLKEEREKSARRSVFLSNLKKDTFVKQIEEHFEQFGKIVKVVSDPKKNSYAIVEFEDESSVEKTLEVKEHKVNGRLLKVSRRELKEFVSKTATSSQEAEKKEHLEKLRQEALTVNTILGKCDSLNDQVEKLISHFKLSNEEVKTRDTICSKLSGIFKQFWAEKEFQVCTFGSSKNGLACKGSDVDMTLLLESYLPENRLKQQVMPKIVARQLNRISSKNSSSNNSNSTEMDQDDEHQIEEVVPEHHDDNSGDSNLKECVIKFFNNKEYDQLIKFDVEIQVKIVARIIQRFSQDIKSLKTITNARCPVVRFFNDTLGINCDLTLNNYLACENTKLIRLYMDLEPNLEKMIYVLRYWFKQKNLFGSASKFNTYTITFMIVFYMQTRKIGYLPTVEYLASLKDKRFEIHGWNCAFETNVEKIKSSRPSNYEQCQDIQSNNFNDLLKGFFEFYSNFPFGSIGDEYRVLCTRSSELISIQEGKTQLSKLSKYINVQDVFDLSHNLTANVSKSTVERFQSEARGSNELLHYGLEPRKSASKGWGLILLMTKKSLPITQSNGNKNEKKSITIGIEKSIKNKDDAQNVSKFVIHILKECLLFSQISQEEVNLKKRKRVKLMSQICTEVDKLGIDQNKSPSKRQKTQQKTASSCEASPHDENNNAEETSSSDDEIEMSDNSSGGGGSPVKIGSFTLRAARNTWIGRRTLKRDLHKQHESLSEIDLERLCSEKLAERNDQCSKEIDFRVDFVYEQTKLSMRFNLLDHLPSQLDLVDFDTLVHFLHIFTNASMEKMFDQWILKNN